MRWSDADGRVEAEQAVSRVWGTRGACHGWSRSVDVGLRRPLTITDLHTRFLLACHGLLSTEGQGVRPVCDRLFREYGLPQAIRTDNGVPFATTGMHGLSQLNVWWIRLGIQHQRILPAHPQQNGAHELCTRR